MSSWLCRVVWVGKNLPVGVLQPEMKTGKPVQPVGCVVLEYKGDLLDRREEGNIRTRG